MKNYFKYTLPALALCALASCSDDDSISAPVDPNAGKELIALFEDNGYGMTRAYPNPEAFSSDTKVYMRIKSEEKGGSGVRYAEATAIAGTPTTADDTHNTDWTLSGTHSHLTYESGQERYWDDAFGRKAQLTVYAVAIANRTDATLPTWSKDGWTKVNYTTNPNWYTDASEEDTISWTVSTKQTSTTMSNEDLAYSNNIKEGEATYKGCYRQTYTSGSWVKSMELGRMIWQSQNPSDNTVTTGKFDMGHLVFKHALTWITINLKEGTGFNNNAATDFVWTNKPTDCAQTITLKGFPTTGTFDVSTGGWSKTTANNITQMNETTGDSPAAQTTRVLNAYVLPGTNLYTTGTNVIEFEIDNAKYYVTGTQIANAIRNGSTYTSFTTTEAGKNYVINLTVAKKGIERITAAVVPWETIESTDAAAKNTYCTFDFEDRDSKYDSDDASKFQIYRAEKDADNYITGNSYEGHSKAYVWGTTYVAATDKTWDATNNEWEATDWYWKDNKTFYHFRAAGSTEGTIPSITTAANDYFGITSGAISGSSYKDYTWGAPFYDQRSSDTHDWDTGHPLLTYSKAKGFDGTGAEADTPTHQISKAIAATDGQIQMLMFHMTSQITVKVQTTSDASAVTLEDGTNSLYTKVEIINMLPTGTVQMGDGLVTANGTRANYTEITRGTKDSGIVPFTFGIVPQELSYTESSTTKYIGLRITTPDNNQYLVNQLNTCYATVTTNNLDNPYKTAHSTKAGYWLIDRWYPNYQYVYTVTVSKKGIERITAAVVPWETVTGDLGTIDLEN